MKKVSQRAQEYVWHAVMAGLFFLIIFPSILTAKPNGKQVGTSSETISTDTATKDLTRTNPTQGVSITFKQPQAKNPITLKNRLEKESKLAITTLIAPTDAVSNANSTVANYLFADPALLRELTINQDSLQPTENNLVALTDTNAQNNLTVAAYLGSFIITSDRNVTMNYLGNDLVNFMVKNPTTTEDINTNNKKTQRSNVSQSKVTRMLVSAQVVQQVLDQAIYMGDMTEAHFVSEKNGEIILLADKNQSLNDASTPNASSTDNATHNNENILISKNRIAQWNSAALKFSEIERKINLSAIRNISRLSNTVVSLAEILPAYFVYPVSAAKRALSHFTSTPAATTDFSQQAAAHVTHSTVTATNTEKTMDKIERGILTADWRSDLIIALLILSAGTAILLWRRHKKIHTIYAKQASSSQPQIIFKMRNSVTELSKFADMMAKTSSGEVAGPWKDYIDHLVANSTSIQDMIKNIQNQHATDQISTPDSITELRSKLKDIMESAELMKQDPHMYKGHIEQYTQIILSDTRRLLEETEKL